MIKYGVHQTFACVIYVNILLVKLSHMAKPEVKGPHSALVG